MADALVHLNPNWRVADDPPQWTLQYRKGNPRGRTSGWVGRKFIRDRDHLLERIDELCGTVDPEAIETIESWPDGYATWKLREMQRCAGPKTAPYSAIVSRQHLGVPEMAETALRALHGVARHG